jgi:hypothetical protein
VKNTADLPIEGVRTPLVGIFARKISVQKSPAVEFNGGCGFSALVKTGVSIKLSKG